MDEVAGWLDDDPGVKAHRWNIEVRPYHWHVGQPRLVPEPIEMTQIQFCMVSHAAKFNIDEVPVLLKKHDDYLKEIQKAG